MSQDLTTIKQLEKEIGIQLHALEKVDWNLQGYRLNQHQQVIALSLCRLGLQVFPQTLLNLTNLQSLDLHNNQFTILPKEIIQLCNLKFLYLNNNQLQTIPQELAYLKNLHILSLHNNPVGGLPVEIIEQGTKAILEYLRQLQKHEKLVNEAKLIVVGQGAVGKTCLVNRLLFDTFEEQPSTEGIDILKWKIAAPTKTQEEIMLNVWDFGGQEIYHATHQFFLTTRSVYLVVWNARLTRDYEHIHYWLHTVEAFSDNSSIILVLSKCHERDDDLNMEDLKKQFPQIVDLYKVDCKDGYGIPALRDIIRETAWKLPHMQARWVTSWFRVRNRLEQDERDYITCEEFCRICQGGGIDEHQIIIFDKYLHDLGTIIHFRKWLRLFDIVILKPEWMTNAVYKVLDAHSVQTREGLLLHSELEKIWDTEIYPRKIFPELLELMVKFELLYHLPDYHGHLVAELLPSTPPKFTWDEIDNLRFYYRYDFLPAGIMTRFIVRVHGDLARRENGLPLCWREGAILEPETFNNTRAYIKVNLFEKLIEIKIHGYQKRELLAIIRHEFNQIHRSIPKITVFQDIPCNCSPNCSYRFDYDRLSYAESLGKKTVECQKTWKPVPLISLLDGYSHKMQYQELWDLAFQKVSRLKQAHIIATDPNEKFRLEHHIHEAERELRRLEEGAP